MSVMKLNRFIGVTLIVALCQGYKTEEIVICDVIIAGGTTAALAAAISSATYGADTCLIEPTDWPGGQLTASAVPAVDFAWHKVTDADTGFTLDVGAIAKEPENITPNFYYLLQNLTSQGTCWVSEYCFPPTELLNMKNGIFEIIANLQQTKKLRVWYDTVVKQVSTDCSGARIQSLITIQRTPTSSLACNGWDIFLSEDLVDWYSFEDSDRWTKSVIEFVGNTVDSIFMDATEWGEVLALSGAPYLQGIDEQYDGDTSGNGNDTCGQSTVFDFIEEYYDDPVQEEPNPYPVPYPDFYSLEGYSWNQVWTYRRVVSTASWNAKPGDFTLQNWGKGNDYMYGYMFVDQSEVQDQVFSGNWTGGVNFNTLTEAEYVAYGYHYWFKDQDSNLTNYVALNSTLIGTCHGLSKIPYMRDTRRSIGIGSFVMEVQNISGPAEQMTGTPYYDRIALAAYDVDIHPLYGCQYPSYMLQYYPILPFFVPFRALTNDLFMNVLVAGKTIAQSFLVNSATRVHPNEWSTGTAAGVAAAFMIENKIGNTSLVLEQYITELQAKVSQFTPINWTINGTLYPPQM